MYWRRVMPFSGDYADRLNLKNSNRLTREEFFGSKARTDFFEAELKRRPKDDPAEILVDMLGALRVHLNSYAPGRKILRLSNRTLYLQ